MLLPSWRFTTRLSLAVMLGLSLLFAQTTLAGDWIHWRGPQQTGESQDTGLPEWFEDQEGGEGLLWKVPYGGRSAPLVLKGRVYTISGYDMSQPTEGERIMCFDAKTGKTLWEKRFNVFHTDIVSSRLGWTTLTADPEKEHIFAHTTAGFLYCLDRDGKEIWKRQLTEEFGRLTGYGGRSVSPLYDSGLVMLAFINSSWGNHARGGNRFVAFDANSGEIVWWRETGFPIKGTYYSNPIITVVNGCRIVCAGGGDGYVHGFKVRTGERVFSHHFSAGVVNPSPVADGNLLYISHGEENPEGGAIGKVVCLDISQIDPKTKEPKVVWQYRRTNRFGLASPALANGLLYVPDDSAEIFCFDAKTGKLNWKEKYGTISRGAPLIADGKLYIFDVNAKLAVWALNGKNPPEILDPINFRRTMGAGFVETHGTPIAADGKLYFLTLEYLYCIGTPEGKAGDRKAYKPLAAETPFDPNAKPVSVRVFPADATAKPGQTVKFELKFLDANGREVRAPADAKVEWSFPLPPKTPTGAQPPALNATATGNGTTSSVTVGKLPRQQGYVLAKAGDLSAEARVRVVAQIPYTEDFEKLPLGSVPSSWVNTAGKYTVVEKNGNKLLSKVNNSSRPSTARANAYITMPDSANYTISADMMTTEVREKVADMGVVNCRYLFLMDGKIYEDGKRRLRIVSWEARMRINEEAVFDWKPGVWYSVRFSVEPNGKTNTVRGKAWPKGEPEPEKWNIEFHDPSPNVEGAAAIYGYVPNVADNLPGSEIFYDNIRILPNANK